MSNEDQSREQYEELAYLVGHLFKAHPWHGISVGDNAPECINAYIEIVTPDSVKFEVDKETGHLRLDRPQRYSNVSPTLYGLIPQTYCGPRVAERCNASLGRDDIVGDGDPLDVCVLSEKSFSHGDFMMEAIPIGGFRMLDGNEADDKIIAVMQGDASFGGWNDISDCPQSVIERLSHYFETYKDAPNEQNRICEITEVYGAKEAKDIIMRSKEDYQEKFPRLRGALRFLHNLHQ